MNLNQINGIVRALAPALVAYLVGKGVVVTDDTVTQFGTALFAIAAAVWSWYTNKPTQIIAQAAANPVVEKVIVNDKALADSMSAKVVSPKG